MKKPLVLFTGGHHNSALEIAKALQKEGVSILWIGHKFAVSGGKSLSAEYQEVTANHIKFLELKTGRFYRKSFLQWFKIAFGFIQSGVYLLRYKPTLIFSSGGYLAVPVVIMGWLLRIPSITHEQTVVAGWANRAIAPFVKKILLTHKSSLANYPAGKSLVVGLPIKKELLQKKYSKRFTPPLLYITCGKQGSHTINEAVFPLIPKLVEKFTIVHQVGNTNRYRDQEKARRIKDRLKEHRDRYLFAPYFFSTDSATYLRSAKVIVSRAGAHNSYELMVLNKKAVLIPIPWVSHNEQLLNAKLVAGSTGSLIIEEKDLTPQTLYSAIIEMSKAPKTKPKITLPIDATQKVVTIIHQYL